MITSFTSYKNTFLFINGIARDIVPKATLSIDSQYGINLKWNVIFGTVWNCGDGGNSGNGSQFDFSIEKIDYYKYNLTNKGNVAKTYTIAFIRL